MGSDAWWVERFNGAIRDIAGTKPGVPVVELAAKVRGKEQSLTLARFDDVHLSNAGHRLAADLLWAAGGFDTTPPDVTLVSPRREQRAPPGADRACDGDGRQRPERRGARRAARGREGARGVDAAPGPRAEYLARLLGWAASSPARIRSGSPRRTGRATGARRPRRSRSARHRRRMQLQGAERARILPAQQSAVGGSR